MERKVRPATADGLVIKDGKTLLVERNNEPYKGFWAIPGGYVEWGETFEEAVVREVREETNLETRIKSMVGVYSDPHRSPDHTITVAYLLEILGGEVKKSEEATDIGWFPLNDLPPLAFDHRQIIDDCLAKIRIISQEENRPRIVVGGLILNKKKEILLIYSLKWGGRFFIPGGHVEEGETIENALKREIEEEVGLKIRITRFLNFQEGIFSPLYYKRKHFIFFDYLCEVSGSGKVKPDKREVEEFIWTPPEKALRMKIDPFTRKTIRALLKEG
ncbi:MAG: NUDIX hydrolase [bacterium]|nr:NUDIX hydrolase [bacterium]